MKQSNRIKHRKKRWLMKVIWLIQKFFTIAIISSAIVAIGFMEGLFDKKYVLDCFSGILFCIFLIVVFARLRRALEIA